MKQSKERGANHFYKKKKKITSAKKNQYPFQTYLSKEYHVLYSVCGDAE
jgi:hypothetical protein